MRGAVATARGNVLKLCIAGTSGRQPQQNHLETIIAISRSNDNCIRIYEHLWARFGSAIARLATEFLREFPLTPNLPAAIAASSIADNAVAACCIQQFCRQAAPS